jgi:hypothetical protein
MNLFSGIQITLRIDQLITPLPNLVFRRFPSFYVSDNSKLDSLSFNQISDSTQLICIPIRRLELST